MCQVCWLSSCCGCLMLAQLKRHPFMQMLPVTVAFSYLNQMCSTSQMSVGLKRSSCCPSGVHVLAQQTLLQATQQACQGECTPTMPREELWDILGSALRVRAGMIHRSRACLHILTLKQVLLQQLGKALLRRLPDHSFQGFWEGGMTDEASSPLLA